MANAHDQLLADVRAYRAAGERLVIAVIELNAMNTAALEDLERGMSLTESVELRDSATWSSPRARTWRANQGKLEWGTICSFKIMLC